MTSLQFDVGALRKAATGMDAAAQDLADKTQSVMGRCSDLSVLGTNDTLGSLAQMLYAAVLERVQQTVDSLVDATHEQGTRLATAADLYAQVEKDNAQAAAAITGVTSSGPQPD